MDLGFEEDTREVGGQRAVLLLQQPLRVRMLALGLWCQRRDTTDLLAQRVIRPDWTPHRPLPRAQVLSFFKGQRQMLMFRCGATAPGRRRRGGRGGGPRQPAAALFRRLPHVPQPARTGTQPDHPLARPRTPPYPTPPAPRLPVLTSSPTPLPAPAAPPCLPRSRASRRARWRTR